MGFAFRRRVKVLPGVHLNLSKSGVGVALGPKGLTHSIGPRGQRTTVSLPGTGLSYRKDHPRGRRRKSVPVPQDNLQAFTQGIGEGIREGILIVVLGFITTMVITTIWIMMS